LVLKFKGKIYGITQNKVVQPGNGRGHEERKELT
jgi:hypothetical protein